MNVKRRPALHSSFRIHHSSLRLFVRPVLAAAAAELPELQALRRRLLILRRHVVAALALGALQHDVVARHNLPPQPFTSLPCNPAALRLRPKLTALGGSYSMMSETVPAPTVRPP